MMMMITTTTTPTTIFEYDADIGDVDDSDVDDGGIDDGGAGDDDVDVGDVCFPAWCIIDLISLSVMAERRDGRRDRQSMLVIHLLMQKCVICDSVPHNLELGESFNPRNSAQRRP